MERPHEAVPLVPGYVVTINDVDVEQGAEGIIGGGALGEVRRGRYKGAACALKSLHMLRTDAASVATFGGALNHDERRYLVQKFTEECELLDCLESEPS